MATIRINRRAKTTWKGVGETASGATGRGETKGGRRSRGIAFKSIIARGHVYANSSYKFDRAQKESVGYHVAFHILEYNIDVITNICLAISIEDQKTYSPRVLARKRLD